MSATSDPIPILPEVGSDSESEGSEHSAYYSSGRLYRPVNNGVVQVAQFRSSPREDCPVADVIESCERATVTRRKGDWLYADGRGWFRKDGWVYEDACGCSSKASLSSSHGVSSLSPSPTMGMLSSSAGLGTHSEHMRPVVSGVTEKDISGAHPHGVQGQSAVQPTPLPRRSAHLPLSASLPERGGFAPRRRASSVASATSRSSRPPTPDSFVRTPSLAEALDLAGAAGPTLKSSIPVQAGSAKGQKKRRYGHDDAVDHDCLWLLGGAAQDVQAQRSAVKMPKTPSLKQVILEEGPPVTMATLLLAWTSASAGILSLSLVHEKGRIWAENGEHVVELTLFTAWVETICCSFLLAVALCAMVVSELCNWREAHRRSQYQQQQHQIFHVPSNQPSRYSVQYQWSLFRSLRGCFLLLVTVAAFGVATACAVVASEYTPTDLSWFFIAAHPTLVLVIRAIAGGSSALIEKIGAAMILVGTGCFGLSNYAVPPSERVTHLHFLSRHKLGLGQDYGETWLGVGLAIASGIFYALCFVGAKHVRLQKKNLQMPLPAFALCCSVGTLVVLTLTAALISSEDDVQFNQDGTHGVFGWTNAGIAKEITLLGCTKGLGLLGFFGALKNLPTPFMAAIFSLQPALIFLAQLALRDEDDNMVPIFTQPVGVLGVLGGCICVCRSSIYRISLIDPASVCQGDGAYTANPYGEATCTGCQSRGSSCPIHGLESLGFGEATTADAARIGRLGSYTDDPPSSRRSRRGSRETVSQSPYARQPVAVVPQVSNFPATVGLHVPYVPEEEPTPRIIGR